MEIMEISDAYSKEELANYRSFWDSEGVSYFEEASEWGAFYTGVLPIKDSGGKTVALACADIPIEALHKSISDYLIVSTVIILIISGLFAAALLIWIRRNVTGPVLALEKSANDFADKSSSVSDYRELRYDRPVINTQNEIQSLASAVAKMADDMILYIERILQAEARAHTAEIDAKNMSEVAYHDALTHVKSKAAYNIKVADINQKIARGDAEFAIVMVDLNNLKTMNDTYGHDNGDKYIIGACQLVCRTYAHSPVYRIGGDEFVAVLENQDYINREELFKSLGEAFYAARIDESREPWERYSAAGGMAVYSGAEGESFEDVFRQADARMYNDKQHMKSQGL
jgi:diguanylate cyclase (GGDEF)-like protein